MDVFFCFFLCLTLIKFLLYDLVGVCFNKYILIGMLMVVLYENEYLVYWFNLFQISTQLEFYVLSKVFFFFCVCESCCTSFLEFSGNFFMLLISILVFVIIIDISIIIMLLECQ